METAFNKLNLITDEFPYLFPGNQFNASHDQTVFDKVVDENREPKFRLVERFIYFMIYSDTKGLLYANIIAKNLQDLLLMGIDMKNYFDSPIAFHKIQH